MECGSKAAAFSWTVCWARKTAVTPRASSRHQCGSRAPAFQGRRPLGGDKFPVLLLEEIVGHTGDIVADRARGRLIVELGGARRR